MTEQVELRTAAEGRVGRVVNSKFTLSKLLGVGGMAAVYEAGHRNGTRVALKVLHPALSMSARQRKRFLREAYLANTIGHPGVVHIYDDGIDTDGTAYLVMELLDGATVGALAKQHGGCLPLSRVLDIADQLLAVLEVAHTRGVVHRDIKPENLFVTARGSLKVLDFGVARLVHHVPGATVQTQDGFMLGTPGFMSQEQARGRWDEVDARSDLWAVGATLFTLVTGELVHAAETPNEQLGKAMTVPARSLAKLRPDLPATFTQCVDRALSFDRAERWSDANSMRAALKLAWDDALVSVAGERESLPRHLSELSVGWQRVTESMPQLVASLAETRSQRKRTLGLVLLACLIVGASFAFTSARPGHAERGASPSAAARTRSSSGARASIGVDASHENDSATLSIASGATPPARAVLESAPAPAPAPASNADAVALLGTPEVAQGGAADAQSAGGADTIPRRRTAAAKAFPPPDPLDQRR